MEIPPRRRKPPYFPFYVWDFIASSAVARLSLRQLGAYVLLLAWQWDSDDCTLPADEAVLGNLSRLGDAFPTEGRPIIDLCFDGRGRKLWNPRLRSEWLKVQIRLDGNSRGGLKSAQSRRKHIEVGSKSTSIRLPSQTQVIQNQNQNQKQTDNGARAEQSPPSPKSRKRERGHGTDDTQARQGCDDLAEIMGRKPDYTATTLGLFARLLREGRTREQWLAVLRAYRDQTTSTAVFCQRGDGKRVDKNGKPKGPGLIYLLRPGEKGGFDNVWIQLQEQTEEPIQKAPWEQ